MGSTVDYEQFFNLSIRLNNSQQMNLVSSNFTGGIIGLEMSSNLSSSLNGGNEEEKPAKVYWALLLILLPILAVFGNVLVILSVYKEKSLQSVTNYFIVSLAFADLLVATVVMPFAVYFLVNVDWNLSETICDFWIAFDVTLSTASILNLVAISIDRFMAVTMPIRYAKHKNNNRVWWTIAAVWIISVAIGTPIVLGLNTSPQRIPELCIFYNSDFIIYSSLGSFYIPCCLMVFLYYKIFKAIHDRAQKSIGSSSSKPAPSSKSAPSPGTGAVKSQPAQSSVPTGQLVKTGSAVKSSASSGGAVKQVSGTAEVREQGGRGGFTCADTTTALVIENVPLTGKHEATSSSASSSKDEIRKVTKKEDEDEERANRYSLIRETTTIGTSGSGQECEEEDEEGENESDDDLPGYSGDSDIEAVECKVIKNKQAALAVQECVVNVVQVDVLRTPISFRRTQECPTGILETEIGSNGRGGVQQKATSTKGNGGNNNQSRTLDSGYISAPSNTADEILNQFCVKNVHVLEDGDEVRPSSSHSLLPVSTAVQEDETSTCIPERVQQEEGKAAAVAASNTAHGTIPMNRPSTISSTIPLTQDQTSIKRKKSRFNLGIGKTKTKTSTKKKKKEKASAKRERKATKTLAIVLGVFLFCWVPFFTCNIMDAICIKMEPDGSNHSESCRVSTNAFLLTTWLGYLNSIVNPVIYTIFNPEFRKAFKKILGIK